MIGGFCAPLLQIAASEVSFAHPAGAKLAFAPSRRVTDSARRDMVSS
jgi:hypothetical protein